MEFSVFHILCLTKKKQIVMKNYSTIILAVLISFALKSFGAKEFNKNDNSEIHIYSMVSEMPEFTNKNYSDFDSFIKSRLKYPLIAKQKGIYESVTVSFVVDIDGIVKNVKIIKGKYPSLNYEAIVAIDGTTGWKAGEIDGLPVPVRIRTTVNFTPADNLPVNNNNLITSDIELKQKITSNTSLNELNTFISKFTDIANSAGWYNCNNSFKYMERNVAKFTIDDTYESVYVVFKTENTVSKDAIGKFNEKDEIKKLIKKPENKKILAIGVKIIDNQPYFASKIIEPKGELVKLEYKKIDKNQLVTELEKLGIGVY